MLRRHMAAALALFSLAICASVAVAAQTVTGTLSGSVLDANGAVVADAPVTAKSRDTGFTRSVTTNSEGYYIMSFLPLGPYDLTVDVKGFRKVTKTEVQIELNKNTVSNFKLEVSSGQFEVQVTGETPSIETT